MMASCSFDQRMLGLGVGDLEVVGVVHAVWKQWSCGKEKSVQWILGNTRTGMPMRRSCLCDLH